VEKTPFAMHHTQFEDPRDRVRLMRDDEQSGLESRSDRDAEGDAVTRRLDREWRALSLKTKLLGPILLVIGTMCLGVFGMFEAGVIELPGDVERGTSTALAVIGSMSAAAGGWSCFVMAMVWRGEPGYAYTMIPGE